MNMIERVARAIDPMAWCIPDKDYPAEKARREARQFTALSNARAAIKAMREPTDTMMDAGNSARVASNQIGHNTAATWDDMIDAALQEDGE